MQSNSFKEIIIRLDHIAYRTKDRKKTADFFIQAFGYKVQEPFEIEFPDGSKAECLALEPPEKLVSKEYPWATSEIEWTCSSYIKSSLLAKEKSFFHKLYNAALISFNYLAFDFRTEYHMAPEIFVSDGTPGSIVGDWVAARNGIGGIHHMAYQVESVEKTMQEWKEKGYAEFTSDKPMTCPGLTQVFTKPSELTGVIYEFIEREGQGFCKNNVKELMLSTKGL